jgi:DNA repair exonuclease SbcCD ATPase subunit
MANTHAQNGTAVLDHENMQAESSEHDVALPAMECLSDELDRLAAVNAELLGRLRGAPATPPLGDAAVADDRESSVVRQENADLRARVAELEKLVTSQDSEDAWAERLQEYEALLDEKSEVIRSLHLKLQEAQEGTRRSPDEPIPKEEELIQLKQELEEQQRQLQQDEESLMAQMRQMELAMSKDRAELARQRQEVQRLQADLNREVEQSSRDPHLRERLNSLRRGQEAPKKEPVAVAAPAEVAKQSSGLFRKLFG